MGEVWDADPKSSYGDFVAVSHPVDAELVGGAEAGCVGTGSSRLGTTRAWSETLAAKKRGSFLVLEADRGFEPPVEEAREFYGRPADAAAGRRTAELGTSLDPAVPDAAARDLVLGLIVARYTQSNTVVMVKDGMTIGVGAGQQSRVDCTPLAGEKAAAWRARRSAEPLTGVSMVSDGALPFVDNVEEAHRHGVTHIAEPGGSIRSDEVAAACAERGITWSPTGVRLFRH